MTEAVRTSLIVEAPSVEIIAKISKTSDGVVNNELKDKLAKRAEKMAVSEQATSAVSPAFPSPSSTSPVNESEGKKKVIVKN